MRGILATLLLGFSCTATAEDWPQRFDSRELDEASGLAMAAARGLVAWAVNDSAGGAKLFGLDQTGAIAQKIFLPLKNTDWEDLADFSLGGENWLVVADVGDNRARRKKVALHWFPEPATGIVPTVTSLEFTYPDGPRDCEAVAVDPRTNEALLLSKRDNPPRLYALNHLQGEQTARFLGTVRTLPEPTAEDLRAPYGQYRSQPTALDISRDGQYLLIVTYKDAYIYRRSSNQTWAEAVQVLPVTIDLPQLMQTEGGSFDSSDEGILVISEGRKGEWTWISLQGLLPAEPLSAD